MNRPESRNALSNEVLLGLIESLNEAAQDPTRVIILTGDGSAFCAGGELNDMRNKQGMFGGNPYEIRERYIDLIQKVIRTIWSINIPLIAAVNGPAVAGGCDLALYCDIRTAAPKAFFAESFIKLGILSGDGGLWIIPRLIGLSRAFEMALTADSVPAQKALEIGLISYIHPAEELLAKTIELAERIARHSSPALRMTKLLLKESQKVDLDISLQLASAIQPLLHSTPEHLESVENLIASLKKKK
jgi:enoyl-CoA hydratase/carnithine racemase